MAKDDAVYNVLNHPATPDEYSWLQAQLEGANLNGATIQLQEQVADEDEEDVWQDPTSSGVLHMALDAIEYGSQEEALALIPQVGAENINCAGPDGDTALHLASLYGKLECAQMLISLGANANLKNPQDQTVPLHDACAGGYLEIVVLLLEKAPATLNARDADGDTPLHCAARGDHLEVVKLLLSKGGDVTVRNFSGNTPDMEAEQDEVRAAIQAAAGGKAAGEGKAAAKGAATAGAQVTAGAGAPAAAQAPAGEGAA